MATQVGCVNRGHNSSEQLSQFDETNWPSFFFANLFYILCMLCTVQKVGQTTENLQDMRKLGRYGKADRWDRGVLLKMRSCEDNCKLNVGRQDAASGHKVCTQSVIY
jgi:hypothetical protein